MEYELCSYAEKKGKMSGITQQKQYLSLVQEFRGGRLAAPKFCAQFTTLWVQDRDATCAKKAAWPQPYDELLLASWRRGEMSDSKFQEKWAGLWGYAEDRKFRSLADEIHSACSVFSPSPELQWELDEEQLRDAVDKSLSHYERLIKGAVRVA